MWECKKCGTKNSDNLNYCPNCGTKKDGNGKASNDIMKVVIPITCLVFAICAIFVTVSSSKKTSRETVVVTEKPVVQMIAPASEPTATQRIEPVITQPPVVTPTPKLTVDHSNLSTSGKAVSDKGVSIEYPKESDFFEEPFAAVVKASRANGAIYIMPKPKSGNGNLGTVRSGTAVTIWAERNGCYFFETSDGIMGWNGTGYFTVG